MERIEALEKELEKVKKHEPTWADLDVLRAYRHSTRIGNELIDIHEILRNVPSIADTLKVARVNEITLSDNSTALMEYLTEFEAEGFKIEGMTTVKAPWTDYKTNDWAVVPAVKLSIK